MLLEAAVVAVTTSTEASRAVLDARDAPDAVRLVAQRLFSLVEALRPGDPLEARVGAVLDAAAEVVPPGPDHAVLELLAASWNGFAAPARAAERLAALIDRRPADRLGLTIRDEHAFWVGYTGRHEEAVTALAAVVQDRVRLLGPDHPDTLSARRSLGDQMGGAGRHDEATTALSAVVADRTRVLGADHPDTLATRRSLGFQQGDAGRHDEAIVTLTAVVADGLRVLQASSPLVRSARHLLVGQLLRAGRPEEAIEVAVAGVDEAFAGGGAADERAWRGVEDLFAPLLELFRAGRPIPPVADPSSPIARRALEVVREMEAARDGAADAGARLPPELRTLVDQLRAEGREPAAAARGS